MVNAVNKREEERRKKREQEKQLEEESRAKAGFSELPASRASQESARVGALRSGDPTAIAAAKGSISGSSVEDKPQIPIGALAIANDPEKVREALGILTPEQRAGQASQQQTQETLARIEEGTAERKNLPGGKFIPEGALRQGAIVQESISQAGPQALNLVATLIDSIRSSVSTKPPKKVSKAKDTLNTAMQLLGTQVQDAKLTGNTNDAKASIELAEDSLFQLKQSQTGLGKVNLDYWIDQGVNVETEIILAENKLNDYKRQLLLIQFATQNI